MQYYIIKIQSCARRRKAQLSFRRLQREDREKKIKKSKRLNTMYREKRHMIVARKFRDVSLSSFYFSSTQRKLQDQREKKAALVIERFFIRVRAEIEIEIARLEREESRRRRAAAKKKKNHKKKMVKPQPLTRNSPTSSVYSFSQYCETPSQVKPPSCPTNIKQQKTAPPPKLQRPSMNNAGTLPPRQMPSIQSIWGKYVQVSK